MSEIPYIAVNDILKVLADRRIDPAQACDGLALAKIRSPFARARWDEVRTLLDRAVDLLGGEDSLRIASGELDRSMTFLPKLFTRVQDQRILYMVGCRWLGSMLWPIARGSDRILDDGRYEQDVWILPQYAGSSALFHYMQGVLESAPTTVGFERSLIEMDVTPKRCRYFVEVAAAPRGEPAAKDALDAFERFLSIVGQLPDARLNATTIDQETDLVQRVYDEIAMDLHANMPNQMSIARRLGMSERSLKRRLQAQGTSFRELRDTQLLERARAMLLEEAPVETVAEVLGFSGARAFRRAYKRWTGDSPSESRVSG